jgi:putative ABC transport system permease protein
VNRWAHAALLTVSLLGPLLGAQTMNAAFLEALPFPGAEQIVSITGAAQPTPLDVSDWFGKSRTVSALTLLTYGRATWAGRGEPRRVDVLVGDHETLNVFGLSTATGRGFIRADLAAQSAALVSGDIWRRELSNKGFPVSVELNGRSYEVVGVAPSALSRLGRFDFVIPRREGRSWGTSLGIAEAFVAEGMFARSGTGVPIADVQRDMERLQRLREGSRRPSTVTVRTLHASLTRSALPTVRVLSLAALVLYLLAAVTIGLIAAMESSERRLEYAIRDALGAGRWRLRFEAMRPWLSALPPALAASLLLNAPLSSVVQASLPSLGAPTVLSLTTFSAGLAFAGLLAAVAAVSTQLGLAVRTGNGGNLTASPPSQMRLTRLLVIAQVALAVGLACAATFAARALSAHLDRPLGLTPAGKIAVEIELGEGRTPEELQAHWSLVVSALLPFEGLVTVNPEWLASRSLWIEDVATSTGILAPTTAVGPAYFKGFGMRMIAGRDPFSSPSSGSEAVVSESLARRLRLSIGSSVDLAGDALTITGIVNDVIAPNQLWGDASLRVYRPLSSTRSATGTIVVRGNLAEAGETLARLKDAVPAATLTPPVPLWWSFARTIEKQVTTVAVLSGYTAIAGLLSAWGLFGVVRRRVAQCRYEVGVRLALGASPAQTKRSLFRPLLQPILLGLALGATIGYQLSKVLAAQLPGANPADPAVFGAALTGALAVGACAVLPALRAAERIQATDLLKTLR